MPTPGPTPSAPPPPEQIRRGVCVGNPAQEYPSTTSQISSTLNLTGAVPGSSVIWLALTFQPTELGANQLVNTGSTSIFVTNQVRLWTPLQRRNSLVWLLWVPVSHALRLCWPLCKPKDACHDLR